MQQTITSRLQLVIFITVMFDFIGFSLPYPLFGPMFLSPHSTFFPADYSEGTRMILLGLTLALYPFGQFLGSPLIGRLSDQYGRKTVLTTSLLIAAFCYLLIAIGISIDQFWLVVTGLFICGFSESNVAIIQATVADLSTADSKAKYFGLINIATNVGWIIGPLVSGKLADAQLVSWFAYSTPFYFAVFFGLLNLSLVLLTFPETRATVQTTAISLKNLLMTFITNFKKPNLRIYYCYALLGFLSAYFYFNFFSPFMVQRFEFGPSQIANFAAYIGIPLITGNYIIKYLLPKLGLKHSGYLSHFFLAISMIIFILPHSPSALWLTIIPVGLAITISEITSAVLVSNAANKGEQGTVMGVYRSLQVLSEMLAALLGGLIASISINLPFIVGAVFAICAGLLLIFFKGKK